MPFKPGNTIWLGRRHSSETKKKIAANTRAAWSSADSGHHKVDRAAVMQKQAAKLRGRKYSAEHRERIRQARLAMHDKLSAAFSGSKNPMWQGGRVSLRKRLVNSFRYKAWRTAVYERDHYTCVLCGDHNHPGRGTTLRIEADHFVKPFSVVVGEVVKEVGMDRAFDEIIARDSIWDINLGRTLCKKCHSETPTYMGRMKHYKK